MLNFGVQKKFTPNIQTCPSYSSSQDDISLPNSQFLWPRIHEVDRTWQKRAGVVSLGYKRNHALLRRMFPCFRPWDIEHMDIMQKKCVYIYIYTHNPEAEYRPWKMVFGRRSSPFGVVDLFRAYIKLRGCILYAYRTWKRPNSSREGAPWPIPERNSRHSNHGKWCIQRSKLSQQKMLFCMQLSKNNISNGSIVGILELHVFLCCSKCEKVVNK